jgi:hypothetical protein
MSTPNSSARNRRTDFNDDNEAWAKLIILIVLAVKLSVIPNTIASFRRTVNGFAIECQLSPGAAQSTGVEPNVLDRMFDEAGPFPVPAPKSTLRAVGGMVEQSCAGRGYGLARSYSINNCLLFA